MSTAIHNPPVEPLIDAKTAAELLCLPKRTVLRLAAQGRLPGAKIGKVWRFWPSKLNDWIQSQMQKGDCA